MLDLESWRERACMCLVAAALACTSARRYYSHAELQRLEGDPRLTVAPGPWPEVPAVLANTADIPDDLVLPTLIALMALPGAVDACDPHTRHPRPEASEYCVALYRTPEDWRVSWPIRNVLGASSACRPPMGGVDDSDFGSDLPIFGYAHSHPCGSGISSQDLDTWPLLKSSAGGWVMVGYATAPSGKLARDFRGQPIPAWGWLATGHRDEPRFYKWNPAGEVFRWNGSSKRWDFVSTCRAQSSNILSPKGVLPECLPEPRP